MSNNSDFFASREGRQVRILTEYLRAKKVFEDNNIHNTIAMFGSARIMSESNAKKHLEKVKQNKDSSSTNYQHDLQKAMNMLEISHYYEATVELSYKLSQWSKQFPENKRYYICSGGGPGIMEAANKGAYKAGEKTIGLNIELPFEQTDNPYLDKELSIDFHYFFLRKFWFAYYAKAFVIIPGGYGTLDEMFEMLTLIQTYKMKKHMPFVVLGKKFFESLINMDVLEKYSLISPEDSNLYMMTDSVDEAFHYITENLFKYGKLID